MISNVEMDNNENSVTPHPDISLNPEISANVSMSR